MYRSVIQNYDVYPYLLIETDSYNRYRSQQILQMEQLVDIVQGYEACRSLVVTIPHRLRESHGFTKGDRFAVKTDDLGRIIYEPLGG